MWLLRLHVLPTPSPARLSVPGGSAPSALTAPLSQVLQNHQIGTSSSELSIIIPEVQGYISTRRLGTQPLFLLGSLTSRFRQVSPAWTRSPGPVWGHSKHQGCGSNPAPCHPDSILPAPGLADGHGAAPEALEKQVFPVPLGSSKVERGRWSLFLCGFAPRAKESCPVLWDMHRGGDKPVFLGRSACP